MVPSFLPARTFFCPSCLKLMDVTEIFMFRVDNYCKCAYKKLSEYSDDPELFVKRREEICSSLRLQ